MIKQNFPLYIEIVFAIAVSFLRIQKLCQQTPKKLKKNIIKKEKLVKELEIGIALVEKYVDGQTILLFKGTDEWSGKIEDTSLLVFLETY